MKNIKNCIRCGSKFTFNPIIQGDDVCNSCEQLTCITHWYPKLYRLDFPMPKTIIIHTNLNLLQDYNILLKLRKVRMFIIQIKEALYEVGTPAFLRTG